RLDAVHAIVDKGDPDIVSELADTVRHRIIGREIHLVLENDRNEARRLGRSNSRPVRYAAQWNDDLHHALHVLVTGETRGYYADVAKHPGEIDRKSTRLNSSHVESSYAVFCLKKK